MTLMSQQKDNISTGKKPADRPKANAKKTKGNESIAKISKALHTDTIASESDNDEVQNEVSESEDDQDRDNISIHADDAADFVLQDRINALVRDDDTQKTSSGEESAEEEGDEFLKTLASELISQKQTGNPLGESLASIVKDIWQTPLQKSLTNTKDQKIVTPSL